MQTPFWFFKKDVKNIAHGVYAPLTGFLRQADFERVVKEMRLADGSVWPIPIVLDIDAEDKKRLEGLKEVLLRDKDDKRIALLKNIEIFS